MWQEPNHVRGEWQQILVLMVKYKQLVDTVSIQRSKLQSANHLDANLEKLKLYISEAQIGRLFQIAKDMNT